jgi:hypothetical protein
MRCAGRRGKGFLPGEPDDLCPQEPDDLCPQEPDDLCPQEPDDFTDGFSGVL